MSALPTIVGDACPAQVPPFRTGGDTYRHILRAWILAASVVAACGTVLFGLAAVAVVGVAVGTAIAAEIALSIISGRPVIGGLSHAALTGLLLALTLPATVPWFVPLFGALVAIVLAKGLFGGLGQYLWQPAVVGRVVVQFLFEGHLALSGGMATTPVLAPGRLLIGDLARSRPVNMATYRGWRAGDQRADADAWLMERPVQALRRFAEGELPVDRSLMFGEPLQFEPLLRDALPPWEDTIIGTVPGGIGETCTIGLIVVGLFLIYRGYLRWELPTAILASAAVAAAVLPVETADDIGGYRWLPILAVEQDRGVGLAYVLHHLTAGQLMLGAFLLSGDMIATPLRARGQVLFGAGVGLITIFMRLYGHLEGECYWAILMMNWLVPAIDRRTPRPVLGMAAE